MRQQTGKHTGNIKREFKGEEDLNNQIRRITDIINAAAEENIPKTQKQKGRISQEIQEIIVHRNRIRRN